MAGPAAAPLRAEHSLHMSKTALVTGSSGLIGSEAVALPRRARLGRPRRRQQHAPRLLRRRTATRPGTWSACGGRRAGSSTTASTSATATAVARPLRGAALRPRRPLRRAAVPRPRRDAPVRRLRRQRRSATLNLLEAARRALPGVAVRLHVDQQGLRRRAQRAPARRARDALGLRRPADATASTRRCGSTQSMHSLFGASKVAADVMVQEYGRYFGHADGVLPRRLPHRARPLRRRAARLPRVPRDGRSARAGRTGSSATRASRCATTSTPTTSARRSWPSPRRRARRPSTTSAAAAATRLDAGGDRGASRS